MLRIALNGLAAAGRMILNPKPEYRGPYIQKSPYSPFTIATMRLVSPTSLNDSFRGVGVQAIGFPNHRS